MEGTSCKVNNGFMDNLQLKIFLKTKDKFHPPRKLNHSYFSPNHENSTSLECHPLNTYSSYLWVVLIYGIYYYDGIPWIPRFSCEESTCQCRRCRFIPLIKKILWRRNGKPLQYSCWEISYTKGTWQAIVHGVTKESDTVTKNNYHD